MTDSNSVDLSLEPKISSLNSNEPGKSGRLLFLLVFSGVAIIGAAASQNIVHPSAIFWLAFLGILGGIIILSNNVLAISILAATVFLVRWLSEVIQIIPRQITWLPELILIGLGLKVLVSAAKQRQFRKTAIDGPLMLLIVFGIISAFINGANFEVVILGIRNYFTYVVLFYVVSQLEFEELFIKRATKILVAVAFLQIPIAIGQRIMNISNPSGDVVVGTIGANASGTLSLFLLMAVSIIISSYLNKLVSARFLTISLIFLFIPMVINETKVTFIIFPLLVLFLVGHNFVASSNKKRALVPILLSIVIFGSAAIGYDLLYTSFYQRSSSIFSESQISDAASSYTPQGTLNRLAVIDFAYMELNRPPLNPLIGVGLGNASDSFFKTGVGAYFEKYRNLNITSTFLARLMWELGYIGLAVFVYMVIKLVIIAERIYKHSQDPFRKSIALAFEGIVLIMAIGIVYSEAFTLGSLAFVFWFLAGCLQRWDFQGNETPNLKGNAKT